MTPLNNLSTVHRGNVSRLLNREKMTIATSSVSAGDDKSLFSELQRNDSQRADATHDYCYYGGPW